MECIWDQKPVQPLPPQKKTDQEQIYIYSKNNVLISRLKLLSWKLETEKNHLQTLGGRLW